MFLALGLLVAFAVIGFPVQVSDGVNIGALIEATNRELGITHKECWLTCGIDGAQWSRMLRGEAPADLWKLRHLGAAWQRTFLAKYADALIRQRWDELTEDLQMARASLRSRQEKAS